VGGDEDRLAAPLDFLGVNHYFLMRVAWDPDHPEQIGGVVVRPVPDDAEQTAMGWEVAPHAMTDTFVWVAAEYGPIPLYVTENGVARIEYPDSQGVIDDHERISYLDRYLRAVRNAIVAGVDVRGYFVWSLVDNFEWNMGYDMRFGVVYVDRNTLERTPKSSYRWLREVVARNAVR
jgi:beta-glucosidase